MEDRRDTSDPYYEDFCPGSCYDLIGLINANVEMKNITGKFGSKYVLYHVALRLGVKDCFTQCIIKIWAKTKQEEPKFTSNWLYFQLAYIKNVKFLGNRERFGLQFMEFVLDSSPGSRFIWLSDSREKFWQFPISNPEKLENYARKHKILKESCPWIGFVDTSKGSILNRQIYSNECMVHSRTIFGVNDWCHFSDFFSDVRSLKRWMLAQGEKLLHPSRKKEFFNLTEGHFFMFM